MTTQTIVVLQIDEYEYRGSRFRILTAITENSFIQNEALFWPRIGVISYSDVFGHRHYMHYSPSHPIICLKWIGFLLRSSCPGTSINNINNPHICEYGKQSSEFAAHDLYSSPGRLVFVTVVMLASSALFCTHYLILWSHALSTQCRFNNYFPQREIVSFIIFGP